MIEHPTLAQVIIATVGVCLGAGVGFILAAIFRSGELADLWTKLAARGERLAKANAEIERLTHRCTELRIALRAKDDRIAELTPLAEEGRKITQQRAANLAKMQATHASRKAARLGNGDAVGRV